MIEYTMPSNATAEDVRNTLTTEVKRRLDTMQRADYTATTKVQQANQRGHINALLGVLHILENLKFKD